MAQQFLRVLLVDDDETNVKRIRRITNAQRAPGFELVQTCDLAFATTVLDDGACDVILLNLTACDDSGLGAYAVLAAHSPDIPILVMAPADRENLALKAVRIGAIDYLITEQIYDTLLVRSIRHGIEQHRVSAQSRRAEKALRLSEARYRALFEQSHDAILIMDADLLIVQANQAAAQLFGIAVEQLAGTTLRDLHDDGTDGLGLEHTLRTEGSTRETEVRLRRADGGTAWCLISAAEQLDGRSALIGYQVILHDITERKVVEQRLTHDAFHDSLTDLPNRARFIDRLDHAFSAWRHGSGARFAVLFVDLDRFKVVNDSLGHGVGDTFLCHIATALQDAARDDDMVARLGGDEFAVLVTDVSADGDALRAAERIQRCLARSFEIEGYRMFTSASIGIAYPDSPDQTAQELLRNADIAMYRAKATGPGNHQVFTAAMHTSVLDLLELETDLRLAVARDEFVMHYQPIIELTANRVIGFEALVRWQHPRRGLLLPHHFIGVAEETGLIVPLGVSALRQACAYGAAMAASMDGQPEDQVPYIAVNISPRQLALPTLVEDVIAALAESGLPPHLLSLEITESTLVSNAATAGDNMQRLRQLGVRICIDDFGTGYSSLSYLHALPITGIKIDRSFINQLEPAGDRTQVIQTIAELGQRLGITIVAEGVESRAQLRQLEQLGVSVVQGFLFSPAIDASAASVYTAS